MKVVHSLNTLLKSFDRPLIFFLISLSISKSAIAQDQQYLKFDTAPLEPKACQNDAQAQTALGWDHYLGQHVDPDPAQANKWLKRAAENGSGDATLQLGVGYMSGSAGKVDLAQSRDWLEKAFHAGNADAGMFLGMLYGEGLGVEKNLEKSALYYEKAREIYESAASNNDWHATDVLSNMYWYGLGVKQDKDKFEHYLHRLRTLASSDTKEGGTRAATDYFELSQNEYPLNDYQKLLRIFENGALKNVSDGQIMLGFAYAGELNVEHDS